MNPILQNEISVLKSTDISPQRKAVLAPFIRHIKEQLANKLPFTLNFICTHNSRRSHLAHVWAAIAADQYGLTDISHYSGGTEATAVFPKIVDTLKSQGITVVRLSADENAVYALKWNENNLPLIAFSKEFDHPFNPKSNFSAIMTCAHADENCPFIPGSNARIALDYDDPKEFDQTPMQTKKYLERSRQIGAEMLYVFSKIKAHV